MMSQCVSSGWMDVWHWSWRWHGKVKYCQRMLILFLRWSWRVSREGLWHQPMLIFVHCDDLRGDTGRSNVVSDGWIFFPMLISQLLHGTNCNDTKRPRFYCERAITRRHHSRGLTFIAYIRHTFEEMQWNCLRLQSHLFPKFSVRIQTQQLV